MEPISSFIDLSVWRRERVCCGLLFRGPYGAVIIDQRFWRPCRSHKSSPPTITDSRSEQSPNYASNYGVGGVSRCYLAYAVAFVFCRCRFFFCFVATSSKGTMSSCACNHKHPPYRTVNFLLRLLLFYSVTFISLFFISCLLVCSLSLL